MSDPLSAAKTPNEASTKLAPRKRAPRQKPATASARVTEDPTPSSELDAKPLFSVDFPVRWRDLDAFNHVNNSSFLTYLEEARLRWLASLAGPWLSETSAPVLASAELQFRRPIPWPETVRVELRALRLGRSSLTLGHRLLSAGDAGILYCEGQTVMVWVDAATGKGASLPEAVREASAAEPAKRPAPSKGRTPTTRSRRGKDAPSR